MTDGYFASTDLISSPEDSDSSSAITSLSLVCHESRMVVLELYSKVLRVYQGAWHRGVKSRLVRCRPETDVLVIYAVPDLSLGHQFLEGLTTREYWQLQKEAVVNKFPRSEKQFTAFKEIISGFQKVAIFSRASRGHEIAGVDLINSTDMRALLYFFTSLKQLYVWLDPACWPDVWEDAVRADDVTDIKTAEEVSVAYNTSRRRWREIEKLQDELKDFLRSYNESVEVQNNHSVVDDTHWVPQPKPLERIGCYCLTSWLR